MKRKKYLKPQLTVYELQYKQQLLVVSSRDGYQNDYNGWEETTDEC